MPKSRKHSKSRRKHQKKHDPLALERMFDQAVDDAHRFPTPPILYHYTTWEGAQGIISSQKFWATAHNCTNDEAELVSADSIIVEVAKELEKSTKGVAAEVLRLFVEGYSKLQIVRLITVCLVCFSTERDDRKQWERYGDEGCGVCLGVRVLDEPGPKGGRSALIKVDYSESSWRSSVARHFGEVASVLSRALSSRKNYELGLSALNRIAAFNSIAAKRANWTSEREIRHVTLVPEELGACLEERHIGGERVRYLPVRVRAGTKRIAFGEIIVGPNQNLKEAHERLTLLLADDGYSPGEAEYPKITDSGLQPWQTERTTF